MKRISKKQMGQLLRTALGIVCVGMVFCLALVFPGYYYEHYDKNTLNQVTYADVQVSTYETSYDSFVEKLYAIARGVGDKKGLHAVRMDEIGFEMSPSELTKIMNKELKKMNECGVLADKIELKKKNIVLYDRYILYGSGGEENFKGISFWKLEYKNKKGKMTFFLDEEFQKVYCFEYEKKMSDNRTVYDVSESQTYVDHKRRLQDFYIWWEGILKYYGFSLQDGRLESLLSEEEFMGTLVFDGKYALPFYDFPLYDGAGNEIWQTGIPMEKMIQF